MLRKSWFASWQLPGCFLKIPPWLYRKSPRCFLLLGFWGIPTCFLGKASLLDKFSLISGNSALLWGNSLLCFQGKPCLLSRNFLFSFYSSPCISFLRGIFFFLLPAVNSPLLSRIYCLLFLEILIYFLAISLFLSRNSPSAFQNLLLCFLEIHSLFTKSSLSAF